MTAPRFGVHFTLLPDQEWGVRSNNQLPLGKVIRVKRRDGMVVEVVPKALVTSLKVAKGIFFTYSIEKSQSMRRPEVESVETTIGFGRKVEL